MNKVGKIMIGTGIVCIFLSIFFGIYNYYEEVEAGNNSREVVEEILDNIQNINQEEDNVLVYQTIKGYKTLGIISLPKLELDLPILTEWDYDRLKVGPCVYYGSIETNDLVICGHSYRTHFKYLSKLSIGDYIIITDVNNHEYIYEICDKDVINPYDIDSVIDSGYDLTLFSCYNGGTERMTIYCRRVNSKI